MSSPRFSSGLPGSALLIFLLLDTAISWTRRCRVEYFPLHRDGHDGHWPCAHSGGGGGEGVQDNGDEVAWTLPVSCWDCLVPPKVRCENQKVKMVINKLGRSCAKLSTAWASHSLAKSYELFQRLLSTFHCAYLDGSAERSCPAISIKTILPIH